MSEFTTTTLLTLGGVALTFGGIIFFASILKKKVSQRGIDIYGPSTDTFELVPLSEHFVPWKCGHDGPKEFYFDIYGTRLELKDVYFKNHKERECGACLKEELKKATIRCALCGHKILPGDPVALYGDMKKFKPEWKTFSDEDKRAVIGCMRWNCCPSGGFFSGNWTGQYIHSPFATGSAVGDAFANPDQMVVTNIGPDGATVERIDIAHPDPDNAS